MKSLLVSLFSRRPSASRSSQRSDGIDGQHRFEDHYSVGRELGRGSFAVVSVAIRRSDGAQFAAKFIDKGSSRESKKAVRDEIEVLKSIVGHPGIISLRDSFETPTQFILVTDLASGGELFDSIVKKGKYTEKDAAEILVQLLDAISYVHSKQIVHRDLKPENLLLAEPTEHSKIVITDFGLAKRLHGNDGRELKSSGGTPGYVAPEVLTKEGHSKPVDVWALGCIAYVLLCGYTPFWGETEQELLDATVQGRVDFTDEPWPDISDAAKGFITSMLNIDPAARPTASQLLQHPWLVSQEHAQIDLLPHIRKNFNAKRTFKMAVHLVQLAHQHSLKKLALNSPQSPAEGAAPPLPSRTEEKS